MLLPRTDRSFQDPALPDDRTELAPHRYGKDPQADSEGRIDQGPRSGRCGSNRDGVKVQFQDVVSKSVSRSSRIDVARIGQARRGARLPSCFPLWAGIAPWPVPIANCSPRRTAAIPKWAGTNPRREEM